MRLLTILLTTAALLLASSTAFAADLDEARRLVDEARPWVRQSDNPDLDTAVRKKARREAHELLKSARGIYDDHLDANPSEESALDSEYCEVASMLYWVRKLASINEFDEREGRSTELPTPTKAKPGLTAKPTTEKPTPEKPDTEKPDTERPGTGDDPTSTPTKPEPGPSEDDLRREAARQTFEAIQADERDHPGDVPRLHALYEKFLATYEDPSLPEYTRAVLRLGALSDRMKAIFREEVGTDPDALKNIDSKEAGAIVRRLTKQLKAKDPADRREAARLLGSVGSGAASLPLVRSLRDPDEEVAWLSHQGLVRLGGTRAAYNLTKSYRDAKPEAQQAAVDVLIAIAAKGPVDAIVASPFLGRFVLSQNQGTAGKALDALAALGDAGGPGLIEALETRMATKKIEIIAALGRSGYHKGAYYIGGYLLRGDAPKTVALRGAAQAALGQMGTPAIPHLIPRLSSSRTKGWTAMVMRQITGETFPAKPKPWRQWWEIHKHDQN